MPIRYLLTVTSSGRPSTTTTPYNNEYVQLAVEEDCRLTVRDVESDLVISKITVW